MTGGVVEPTGERDGWPMDGWDGWPVALAVGDTNAGGISVAHGAAPNAPTPLSKNRSPAETL